MNSRIQLVFIYSFTSLWGCLCMPGVNRAARTPSAHLPIWGVSSEHRQNTKSSRAVLDTRGRWRKGARRPERARVLGWGMEKNFHLTRNGQRLDLVGSWEEWGSGPPMVVLGQGLCDFWVAIYLQTSCVWSGLLPSDRWEALREDHAPTHTAVSRGKGQGGVWLPSSAYNRQQSSQRPDMPITPRQIQQDQQGLFCYLA